MFVPLSLFWVNWPEIPPPGKKGRLIQPGNSEIFFQMLMSCSVKMFIHFFLSDSVCLFLIILRMYDLFSSQFYNLLSVSISKYHFQSQIPDPILNYPFQSQITSFNNKLPVSIPNYPYQSQTIPRWKAILPWKVVAKLRRWIKKPVSLLATAVRIPPPITRGGMRTCILYIYIYVLLSLVRIHVKMCPLSHICYSTA